MKFTQNSSSPIFFDFFLFNFPIYHNSQNECSFKNLCKPTYSQEKMWIKWITQCISPFYRIYFSTELWIKKNNFFLSTGFIKKFFRSFVQDYFTFFRISRFLTFVSCFSYLSISVIISEFLSFLFLLYVPD